MGMVKTTRFQNIFLKGAALLIAIAGFRGMEQTQMIAQVFFPFTNNGKDEHVTVINNQPMMRQEELRNQKGNQEENEQQKIQNQQEENALRDEWKIPEQEQPFSNKQNEQNQISDQVDDAKLKELLGNTICTLLM